MGCSRRFCTVFPTPLYPQGSYVDTLVVEAAASIFAKWRRSFFFRLDALLAKTRQDIYNSASRPVLLNHKPLQETGGSVVGL